MQNPHYILRPVSPRFIACSLFVALVLNLLPWGHRSWIPDFVALTLVFWNIHHARRVGVGVAFLMGLLMDVGDSTLLGQHALAYTLLSYGAIMMHRRILWFSSPTQALHVFPLFLGAQFFSFGVVFLITGAYPSASIFIQSAVTAVLWPGASWLLLAPQRRPLDRDENRPI